MDSLHCLLMAAILILSIWVAVSQFENSYLAKKLCESDKIKASCREQITKVMVELDKLSQSASDLENLCKEQKRAYDESREFHTYESMDFPRASMLDF